MALSLAKHWQKMATFSAIKMIENNLTRPRVTTLTFGLISKNDQFEKKRGRKISHGGPVLHRV